MSSQQAVRDDVSTRYAKAVTQKSEASEMKEGCCGGAPVQKGTIVKIAGYTSEELEALPPEAVVNSFGCGNPLAFAQVEEGQTVVDLGSGAGIDILIAAKKVGPTGKAIGIDMTDEMIAKANENIATSGLDNVEVRKGIIEKMPIDDGSVDWVISNCVINLSPEKPKVFAEVARVLKSGGTMQVSDIVVQELPDWVREDKALYSACVSGAISEEEYIAGLEEAGLTDIEVMERLVYDKTQLKGLMKSELTEEVIASLGCCGGNGADVMSDMAEQFEGKIWSAKIRASKP
jgi:ubiquinone/menaquinone biosynthesis C-methylase UbiE